MAEVERLCSSVIMMNKGEIIEQGKPNELIKKHNQENMEEVFLKLTRRNMNLNRMYGLFLKTFLSYQKFNA